MLDNLLMSLFSFSKLKREYENVGAPSRYPNCFGVVNSIDDS